MAMLQAPFNPTQFDPTQSAGQLPIGNDQLVVVKASEAKPAKSGGGNGYLQFDLEVIDGPNKGATGPYRLNIYHSNPETVQIAYRQLSAVCHVIGHLQELTDTAALHNRPFRVDVGLQKGTEAQEKGYTEVKKVKDQNGNEPGQQGAGQTQQAPAGFAGQQPQGQTQQPQQNAAFSQPQNHAPNQTAQPGNPWGNQQPQQQQPAQQQPQQEQAATGTPWQQGSQQSQGQQSQQGGTPWQQQPQQGGGAAPWQQGQ